MVWKIVRTVKDRYTTTPEKAEPRAENAEPASQLYKCPDCRSVYIADELDTCGSCGTCVDDIPNERDLGITSQKLQ